VSFGQRAHPLRRARLAAHREDDLRDYIQVLRLGGREFECADDEQLNTGTSG